MPTAPVDHARMVEEYNELRSRLVLTGQRFNEVQESLRTDTVMQSSDAASIDQMETHAQETEARLLGWGVEAEACRGSIAEHNSKRTLNDEECVQARIEEDTLFASNEVWMDAPCV